MTDARPVLGILMLDSRFPRPPGDIGNAQSWDHPVRFHKVAAATPDRIVRGDDRSFLNAFVAGAQILVDQGAQAITTSCGFLVVHQDALAARVPVPILTSALLMGPGIARTLPKGQRVGVLTISGRSLTADHLKAAGLPLDTPIGSTEGGETFTASILDNSPTMDLQIARRDNVTAAEDLCRRHPEIGAILLECTNMPPYAADIAARTGRPVYSILNAVSAMLAGFAPPRFDG